MNEEKYYLKTFGWSILFSSMAFIILVMVSVITGEEEPHPGLKYRYILLPIYAIVLPITNLPVFFILFMYRFKVLEVFAECMVFEVFFFHIKKWLCTIFPPDWRWQHKEVSQNLEVTWTQPVWWMDDFMFIIYPIILTTLVFLCYFCIKQYVTDRR